MSDRNKIKLVQALSGAVVLTILMQGMTLLGMPQYIWMLFLPLLMFFALGADFKKIPSMLIGYAVGELWCVVNSLVSGAFAAAFGDNPVLSQLIPTILVIFCIHRSREYLRGRGLLEHPVHLHGHGDLVHDDLLPASHHLPAPFWVLVLRNRPCRVPRPRRHGHVLGHLR